MPALTKTYKLKDLPSRKRKGATQYFVYGGWWEPNHPRWVTKTDAKRNKALAKSKKIVFAANGGEGLVLSYGAAGSRHNYSTKGRSNYRKRHLAQHPDKANDILTPFYWALNALWDMSTKPYITKKR